MQEDFSRFTVPPKETALNFSRPRRKSLILDLDSTLVYTYLARPEGINLDSGHWLVTESPDPHDNTVFHFYVLIRPYAREFVSVCSQHYDVFILTAGDRGYAEPILRALFPQIPPARCFYRDSCRETGVADQVIKDLKALPVPFNSKHMFLFDDCAPDNTFPEANGMFCGQFAPPSEEDSSPEAIEELLHNRGLESYASLLVSERFVNAEDVRMPIAEYHDSVRRVLEQPVVDVQAPAAP